MRRKKSKIVVVGFCIPRNVSVIVSKCVMRKGDFWEYCQNGGTRDPQGRLVIKDEHPNLLYRNL